MALLTTHPTLSDARAGAAGLRLPGLLLGVAFGGFFDGIVLHQILQWHHLLSGLSEGRWGDLRVQLLVDGLFHALMYVLALGALVLLVRRRSSLMVPGASDALLVMFITGFALWHLLDAVLSHWLLGIHRIRMDSSQPLAWDLGWLLIFGLLPWLWARRHARKTHTATSTGSGNTLMVLVCTTALAGALAARSPPDAPTVVLLQDAAQAGALLVSLPPEARIIGSDASGTVWFFTGAPPPSQSGAWTLRGTWLPAGCSAWTRV